MAFMQKVLELAPFTDEGDILRKVNAVAAGVICDM